MKRKMVGFLVCTLLITTIIPFSVTSKVNEGSTIIYVDDDGTADYATIQDAIDDASDGCTIFVYSGTYNENIHISSKSVILLGENKETTIIDGGGSGDVVKITSDFKTPHKVKVSGFNIKNSGNNHRDVGLEICSNDIIISDNIIKSNTVGIWIWNGENNVIKNNIIRDNKECGIDIVGVFSSIVENNEIFDTAEGTGLKIQHLNNVLIRKNNISNNNIGLTVLDNAVALWLIPHQQNIIMNNNFFDNTIHAGVYDRLDNYWGNFLCVRFFHNYWGGTRVFPKLILALKTPDNPSSFLCNIDLLPAKEPYDIQI